VGEGGLDRGGDPLGGPNSLSGAETHPRGRQTLERGGDSPEGASSPRARQRL
jgi:hypothetical protein